MSSGLLLFLIFIFSYCLIVFEHQLKINKAGVAILMGAVLWFILFTTEGHLELFEIFGEITAICFFLIAALTIVETMEAYHSFSPMIRLFKNQSIRNFTWIMSGLTFILSAILDNLTTTVLMISILQRTNIPQNKKLLIASVIIVAANAGGVFSPIGDITTTMLWMSDKVSTGNVITTLFFPSLVSYIVPTVLMVFFFFNKGEQVEIDSHEHIENRSTGMIVLALGTLALLLVPLYKIIFSVPPYLGILLNLGIFWLVLELFVSRKHLISNVLKKLDHPTILFFLGILLAVSALDHVGVLKALTEKISSVTSNLWLIGSLLGVLSAIIDNIPLLAATIKMYSTSAYPKDHDLWLLLAYTTGYGGNLLVIGSAAGVAAMGMMKIDFLWYLKKVTPFAFVGYLAGLCVLYFFH